MQGLQINPRVQNENYNWLLTEDLSTSSRACQHLSALQWQRLSHNFANWLQKECYLPGVSFCVLVISLLNSIVVEKVGELNELGFPAFQLSEKVEDCTDAISEEKLYAPTQQKSLCNDLPLQTKMGKACSVFVFCV